MKNILSEIVHALVQIILIGIPVLIAQHYSFENLTIGGLLSYIYSYLVKRYSIQSAVAEATGK